MTSDDHSSITEGPQEFRLSMRAIVMMSVVGVVLATLLAVAWFRRGSLPAVDAAALDQAQSRWEANAPSDYAIEVQVTGRQGATYYVEVRDGDVIRATRNGQPLTQQRTLGTWSVPGMFETIAADVEHLEKIRRGITNGPASWLTLRARFHPRYGYPERYIRLENSGQSTATEVAWSVIGFSLERPDRPSPGAAPESVPR
ncbi:MAG: hypothetical protein RIS70_3766 [Planctomycetota bacterium]